LFFAQREGQTKKYAIHDSLEDAMTTSVEQAFLFCGGIFLLSFLAIWAFWFVERWRGDNAPKPAASAEQRITRR
jgi:hypothetical protein